MRLRTDGLTWQEIDGELVLLDMKSSEYLTTNVAGALLAKLLVEDRTLEDLASALVEEFDIDRPRAIADTERFVEELRSKALLVEGD